MWLKFAERGAGPRVRVRGGSTATDLEELEGVVALERDREVVAVDVMLAVLQEGMPRVLQLRLQTPHLSSGGFGSARARVSEG